MSDSTYPAVNDHGMRRATRSDRSAVTETLARAFDEDPVLNFLLRQDAKRQRAFRDFFDIALTRLVLPEGEAWTADGGAALWIPPNRWKARRMLPALPRVIAGFGWSRWRASMIACQLFQREHPRAPHWYLYAIGVDPARQGRGIGSALLRAVLSRCDQRGEAAYLEASSENNARLYARHGFQVIREIRIGQGGPIARLMWREPGRPADAPPIAAT